MRVIAAGDALIAPAITKRLIAQFARSAPARVPPAAFGELTPREQEVLRLVARGLSNAEIAAELVLSDATVKTHVKRVLAKLGLRDRVQAVVLAYETGLVTPGSPAERGGELAAGLDVELLEDVAQVRVDRRRGDEQLLGDLAVGAAVGGELGDAPLATASARRCPGARAGAGGRRWRAARCGRGRRAGARPRRTRRPCPGAAARAPGRAGSARRSAAPSSTRARASSSRCWVGSSSSTACRSAWRVAGDEAEALVRERDGRAASPSAAPASSSSRASASSPARTAIGRAPRRDRAPDVQARVAAADLARVGQRLVRAALEQTDPAAQVQQQVHHLVLGELAGEVVALEQLLRALELALLGDDERQQRGRRRDAPARAARPPGRAPARPRDRRARRRGRRARARSTRASRASTRAAG